MAKFIIAIVGTILLTALAGHFLYKVKPQPEAPVGTMTCLTNNECKKACVAIVELQMKRIKSAQRIDQKEYDMIVTDSRDACEYACEAVKNK